MALVTAFQIAGLKIWFWSNDHEPPHFHVKQNGNWEVKISFLEATSAMIEIVFGKPKSKALRELTKLTEQHRLELFEQWQQIRESEARE